MSPLEKEYNDLLIQVGQFTTVATYLPLVVAIFKVKHFNKPLWVFFGYIVATVFTNSLEQIVIWAVGAYPAFLVPYLHKLGIENTLFLSIFSTLKNLLLIGWFYRILLKEKSGKFIGYLSIFLAIFAIIDYLFITGYKVTGVLMPTIVGFFVVLVPMTYLWFLYKQNTQISIYKIPYFWFSIALVIAHLLGLLFYFMGEKVYKTDFVLYVKISVVRNTITILRSCVFAYGFWMAKYVRFLLK